jgi:hypothetical protein
MPGLLFTTNLFAKGKLSTKNFTSPYSGVCERHFDQSQYTYRICKPKTLKFRWPVLYIAYFLAVAAVMAMLYS